MNDLKKFLILVIAVAFATGLASGINVANADGNTNTGGGSNTNTGGGTNSGGNTNTGGGTVRRISWGQLKVMYLDPPTTKNSE